MPIVGGEKLHFSVMYLSTKNTVNTVKEQHFQHYYKSVECQHLALKVEFMMRISRSHIILSIILGT
jgi:hypothetical protein